MRLLNGTEEYNFCFKELDYKKLSDYDSNQFLQYFMAKMRLTKSQREELCLKIEKIIKKIMTVSMYVTDMI